MWQFEHSETTSATPDQLWARYADPASWPAWDDGTESVTVEGPMAVGTRGRLKPKGGPTTTFEFVEVEPGRGFTDVTRLPLARLEFSHRIEPHGDATRFTHRITITGPLSPLFARVVGRNVAAGLPGAMRTLARLAEE
jgi:polyketide cyclase/dehydrase/lipid transport protein